mmetsp:Transcript_39696/g.65813  ORF Transcript_39696/g.65813 Transcript_39696/m.65813 type:complete len:128 (-) Transcript_39696:122-505(-)|eukprot:CAMPEP_0119308734 /NCGR_PEP_ID=MMETSP1333-20130426/12410_1 /TAXON_ID=418940 /ORGANISM="Scyphosphaera apsteinii, Strain RCC1455" /LENGTH=127 /DNA_ID=CAMNT_0007312569 /DNA_START=23 /DNA_END=406 /DNA_ORIENTATION=+
MNAASEFRDNEASQMASLEAEWSQLTESAPVEAPGSPDKVGTSAVNPVTHYKSSEVDADGFEVWTGAFEARKWLAPPNGIGGALDLWWERNDKGFVNCKLLIATEKTEKLPTKDNGIKATLSCGLGS